MVYTTHHFNVMKMNTFYMLQITDFCWFIQQFPFYSVNSSMCYVLFFCFFTNVFIIYHTSVIDHWVVCATQTQICVIVLAEECRCGIHYSNWGVCDCTLKKKKTWTLFFKLSFQLNLNVLRRSSLLHELLVFSAAEQTSRTAGCSGICIQTSRI